MKDGRKFCKQMNKHNDGRAINSDGVFCVNSNDIINWTPKKSNAGSKFGVR